MKEVKKIAAEEAKPRLPLMFFLHHGIFCDLKLNRGTEKWNIFILCKYQAQSC